MDILFYVVIGLFVFGVYYYFRSRQKKTFWEGKVISKDERSITHSDGDDSTWFEVKVELDDSSVKTIEVKEKLFEQVKIGDRLIKSAGELHPRIK